MLVMRIIMLSSQFFVAALLFATIAETAKLHPLSRRLEVRNEAGEKIAIDWVHPVTGETVSLGEAAAAGDNISFDSFVNHTFLFRALSDNATISYLTVSPDEEEQIILVTKDLKLERLLDPTAAATATAAAPSNQDVSTMAQLCRTKATARLASGTASVEATVLELVSCLEAGTAAMLEITNEELAFQKELRRSMASLSENYTCSDPTLETTQPKQVTTWTYEGQERTVGILHQHEDSLIHVLHEFISPEECAAIEEAAAPILHRGTVADGKGGSKLSDNRKAWQAGINVKDWKDINNPIANVKRRLFAYANHATGYNMTLPGQEDIMSIQYFANAEDDTTTPPDRYMPHCDGDCNGLPHKTGGRVATMVMYCDVPATGGATNFQQANVYVKPARGAAAFFYYMDPVTGVHDGGFTTHSGCPVTAGTKRIAVQWMRIGVDAENPWDSFDTNTVSMKKSSDSSQ